MGIGRENLGVELGSEGCEGVRRQDLIGCGGEVAVGCELVNDEIVSVCDGRSKRVSVFSGLCLLR